MLSFQDLRQRVSEVLRGRAPGPDARLRLAGLSEAAREGRVGGVWRGVMTQGEHEMEILVTICHEPREGRPTWHATGTSRHPWTVGHHDTSLGPVVIKTHSFNPEGHYFELDGFGDTTPFMVPEIH